MISVIILQSTFQLALLDADTLRYLVGTVPSAAFFATSTEFLASNSLQLQELKYGVFHPIVTDGPPVHVKARRLDTEKFSAVKARFDFIIFIYNSVIE